MSHGKNRRSTKPFGRKMKAYRRGCKKTAKVYAHRIVRRQAAAETAGDAMTTEQVVLPPHADPDGILRDGGLRREFFRMKCTDMSNSDIMSVLYLQYNTVFFGGALPIIPLDVVSSDDIDFLGRLCWDVEDGPRRIMLSTEVFAGYEPFRNTLLHEMCHQYVREVLRDVEEAAHGLQWQARAARCGIARDY